MARDLGPASYGAQQMPLMTELGVRSLEDVYGLDS